MGASDIAKRYAKKKAKKTTKKLILKVVSFVGLPTILIFFMVTIIAGSAFANMQDSVALLSIKNKKKGSNIEKDVSDMGEAGKATYVGVDDSDTALSRAILNQTRKWSNPYYNGYGGLCELWCAHVYRSAGYPYSGSCCARSHGAKYAKKSGKIPKGALIFSGMRPNGSMYENGHRPGAYCSVCGHYAGHVAIYVGKGMVAGSQVPYLYSLDAWIETFGYGGWSLH